MKELILAPVMKFDEKHKCSIEVLVSSRNLIIVEDLEKNVLEAFSAFKVNLKDIFVKVSWTEECSDRVRIKIDTRSEEENDFILASLELFVHLLGNVRMYNKKIEYGRIT
jgi:hypothetical protein